jgi:integrase
MTAKDPGLASGMTEAGIRAAIAQLEKLLPERSCAVRALWDRYVATLPSEQRWVSNLKSLMRVVFDRPLVDGKPGTLGDVQVIELRQSHWSDYKSGPGHHLNPTTRNLQLARVKSMLKWGIEDGLIYDSPFLRVKTEPARAKRETEISEDDETRILADAPLHIGVMVRVAMGSGMRHDEIRLLRWEQVDLEAKTVSLLWDENKSRRAATVNLTDDAVAALRLMTKVAGNPYVFPSDRRPGQPLSYTFFWRRFRATVDGLGVKAAPGDGRVHAHDMRHSVASRLNRRGAKLTDIQGVLRHANLATTAGYIHVRAEEIAAAAALLEQPRKGPQRATRSAAPTRVSKVGGAKG